MPKVTMIPATRNPLTHLPSVAARKRRVAGYARVSTDSDEQFTSYEAQVDYYTKFIQSIPSCNTEGLTCRRETVDLVLEERCRRFYLRPFQLADKLGCVQHIIKDIRNVSQALLVLPEDQFRIDREIQPSQKEDQLLVALDRPEQINKVTVVVVEDLIRIYFQDTAAKGITARNQLIEMATASLSDLMKEHPEHRAEAKQDLQLLNAQKMGEHEAEIEKIKNVFLAILRDIKKDIDNGEQPGEAVTAAMFQAMRDALAEQKQKPLSIDDVTAMIAGQIGQLAPMDEETADLFQRLVKKMIEQAEK